MGASYSIEPLRISPHHRESIESAIKENHLSTVATIQDDAGFWLEVQPDHYPYNLIETIEDFLGEVARSGWIDPPVQLLRGLCDDDPFCMLLVSGLGASHVRPEAVFDLHPSQKTPATRRTGIARVEMLTVSDGNRAVSVSWLPQDVVAHIASTQDP